MSTVVPQDHLAVEDEEEKRLDGSDEETKFGAIAGTEGEPGLEAEVVTKSAEQLQKEIEEQTANDEALARALASQFEADEAASASQYHNHGSSQPGFVDP